ncbi:MAG: tRNA 5-methylaminomethyl-2-thiouridine biosynthesis bifunctional protein [Candidatus Azotimanducaceae bacterium]
MRPTNMPPTTEPLTKKNPESQYLVDHAEIQWRDDTTPWSPAYTDIYWHRLGGLAEKQHVFIEANQLRERWQNLQQNHFTVVETGFGFGLNFLLAARLWQQVAPNQACLHFIAIEHAPVTPEDLARLYAGLLSETAEDPAYDGLAELAGALIARYPMPSQGMHALWITDNICLTLIYADIVPASTMLSAPVDAFFLDGFSPSLNSAMWDPRVFELFAKQSHADTTLSTYSVAGVVKRGLRSAGFTIRKVPGFGGKAEMLTARLSPPSTSALSTSEFSTATEAPNPRLKQKAIKRVAIIGAGLAGLNCARALQRRGIEVVMFDARPAPLLGASVIPQLAIYPQLAAAPDNRARFSLAAFQYLLQQGGFDTCGFTVAADTPRLSTRLDRVNAYFPDNFVCQTDSPLLQQQTDQQRTNQKQTALAFANGGWLNAADYFATTLAICKLHLQSPVDELTYQHGQWQLLNPARQVLTQADVVIIAHGASGLPQTLPIQLDTNRGQALHVRVSESAAPDQVISGPITVFPPNATGFSTVSGTHARDTRDDTIWEADTQALLAQLQDVLPHFLPDDPETIEAYAGLRSTTRDRLPVVGPIPDWTALAHWSRHHSREQPHFDAYQPGLFFCGGLGSHGATHAPLCGEILARMINTEPGAVDPAWLEFLAPGRFMQRDLRRMPAGSDELKGRR